MNHPNWIYSVSIAVLCAYGVVASHAAQNAPTFMSKDGQIQSVNKYSSNPFWSPNSPYNQRIPTPIYATGPDLTTGDCNTVVKTLVASHCAARNNCTDLRISDVRPNIMVQLSQLPGHSYATSCGGYIDSAFENYKKTYGNVSAVNIVYSGNNKANNTLRLTPATYTPTETETRTAELERLQKETTPGAGIDATLFPKTVDDLSFTDRLANTTVGYEPYKNKSSYVTPMFETESEYYERMKTLLEHQITYVNAGAATGCPKTYLTGRGATVSCVPTRDPRSEFVSWCLDAKLTNCAQEYIISPTDRDDKVFYAKWDCISNSVKRGDKCECTDPHMNQYCECTGIYKPDPSDATRCACVNGENPANNCGTPQITPPSPSTCPDPIMDPANNCACPTGTNNTANPNKCECNNGKSNPPTCDGGTPPQTCPDPHMDPANSCACPTGMNNTADPNKCECDNGQDPANNCHGPYALLQCRSETVPYYSVLGDGDGNMSDPFTDLGCKTNTPKSLRKCFTRCRSNYNNDDSPGLVNQQLSNVIQEKFCAGYFTPSGSYAYPVGFFSYANNPRMVNTMETLQIMTFDSAQIVSIKNTIGALAASDRKEYCYTKDHKYWLIYILEQNGNGTWKVAESPLILYHDN